MLDEKKMAVSVSGAHGAKAAKQPVPRYDAAKLHEAEFAPGGCQSGSVSDEFWSDGLRSCLAPDAAYQAAEILNDEINQPFRG
jgi:hypothetical protein